MSKDTFSVMFMWVTVHPPAPIFFGGMGDAAVDGGARRGRQLARDPADCVGVDAAAPALRSSKAASPL